MKYYFSIFISIALLVCVSTSLKSQGIDELINEQKYDQAIGVILQDATVESLSTLQLENLGYCYVMTNRYRDAEIIYFELTSRPNISPENYRSYAELLVIDGKYEKAKDVFQTYLDEMPNDEHVKIRLISCDSLINWRHLDPAYSITNFDEICTKYNEISGSVDSENVIFLSNRRLEKEIEINQEKENPGIYLFENNQSTQIKKYITDKYWCSISVYSEATNQYAHSIRLIVEDNDGFHVSKSKILFEDKSNNSIEGLKMFVWEEMPEDVNVSHPAFDKSGSRLYFACDMPGGYGGMDIYYSDFENDSWSEPKNVGSNINTSFDDIAPVVDDSVLYFSSLGLPGYGNYDIYVSRIDGNMFSKAENLRSPINSCGDDLFFIPYSNNKYLLSSKRSTLGKGGFDVNLVTLLKEEPEIHDDPPVVIHKFDIERFETTKVFFEIDKSDVYDVYLQPLKTLADSLIEYDDVNVKIIGYTDQTGATDLNSELSFNRAKSVSDQLVEFGVPESQISFEGVGVKIDGTMDQLRFHVIIGTIDNDKKVDWFSNYIDNKYDVLVMPNRKYYSYCVGDFDNMADAEVFRMELKNQFDINGISVSSYLGRCLPRYELSINRRVDISLFRENEE